MDDDAAAARTAGPSTSSTARWGRRSILLLMWSLAELVTILVYAFAGRLWGFVVAGVLLVFVFIFTFYYLRRSTRQGSDADSPLGQQRRQVNGGVGLSQGDIEAIPAFEYRTKDTDADADADAGKGGGSGPSSSTSSVEECAVCISVLRDGETVRRLPACGHAFHARCINGWLRGHATCPICRAGIKVVAADGEPSPLAAVV